MLVLGLILVSGQYANSPLRPWFESLASKKGLCCSFADGRAVEDVDWQSKDGHYQVRLDNKWIDVPDNAVVTGPNWLGKTVVWPIWQSGNVWDIRCFMPGAGG